MSPTGERILLGAGVAISLGVGCWFSHTDRQLVHAVQTQQQTLQKVKTEIAQQKNTGQVTHQVIPSIYDRVTKIGNQLAQAQSILMKNRSSVGQSTEFQNNPDTQHALQVLRDNIVSNASWQPQNNIWYELPQANLTFQVENVNANGMCNCVFIYSDPKTHDIWAMVQCQYSVTGKYFTNFTGLETVAGSKVANQGGGDIIASKSSQAGQASQKKGH